MKKRQHAPAWTGPSADTIGTEDELTTIGRIVGTLYGLLHDAELAFKWDQKTKFGITGTIASSLMTTAITEWAKTPNDIEWAVEFYTARV